MRFQPHHSSQPCRRDTAHRTGLRLEAGRARTGQITRHAGTSHHKSPSNAASGQRREAIKVWRDEHHPAIEAKAKARGGKSTGAMKLHGSTPMCAAGTVPRQVKHWWHSPWTAPDRSHQSKSLCMMTEHRGDAQWNGMESTRLNMSGSLCSSQSLLPLSPHYFSRQSTGRGMRVPVHHSHRNTRRGSPARCCTGSFSRTVLNSTCRTDFMCRQTWKPAAGIRCS